MTAFLRDLLRYCGLIHNLVLRDLKLKYRGSVLGIIWSLLNPLLTLAVYSFAFHTVLRVQMENYPFFLLVSLLPWQFFSSSLLASTGSIVHNAHLIRKVYFPAGDAPGLDRSVRVRSAVAGLRRLPSRPPRSVRCVGPCCYRSHCSCSTSSSQPAWLSSCPPSRRPSGMAPT